MNLMNKSAYELCLDFYTFIKESGRKSATLEEFERKRKIQHKLYPDNYETLSSEDLKTIRSALSSGHTILKKMSLVGYKPS
ncbi:hypothetical protein LBHL_13030 [Lactobacillus helveticus]|nr:hypothetical protein LBHL_13030 [Lactobacillus helveticus]